MLHYIKRSWGSLIWLNITLPSHILSEWVKTSPARPPAHGFNGLWLRGWSPPVRWRGVDQRVVGQQISGDNILHCTISIINCPEGCLLGTTITCTRTCPAALHRQWQRELVYQRWMHVCYSRFKLVLTQSEWIFDLTTCLTWICVFPQRIVTYTLET